MGGMMIQCKNTNKFVSYILRKECEGAKGGDWFHFKCIKMKNEPKGDWICQKCIKNEPKISLMKQILAKENKKVISVKPDGNCLFSALSVILYGIPDLHYVLREKICIHLLHIVENAQNEEVWNNPSHFTETPNDPGLKIFILVAKYYKFSGLESLGLNSDTYLSKENFLKYIKT